MWACLMSVIRVFVLPDYTQSPYSLPLSTAAVCFYSTGHHFHHHHRRHHHHHHHGGVFFRRRTAPPFWLGWMFRRRRRVATAAAVGVAVGAGEYSKSNTILGCSTSSDTSTELRYNTVQLCHHIYTIYTVCAVYVTCFCACAKHQCALRLHCIILASAS